MGGVSLPCPLPTQIPPSPSPVFNVIYKGDNTSDEIFSGNFSKFFENIPFFFKKNFVNFIENSEFIRIFTITKIILMSMTRPDIQNLTVEIDETTGKVQNNLIYKEFFKNEHYKWFNLPNGMSDEDFRFAMEYTMEYLRLKYQFKRVVLKDGDNVVGFMIYSATTKKKETYGEMTDETPYPVILSVGIKPEYRNQKLFNKMLKNSEVSKPFIIHTNKNSPKGLWEHFGSKSFFEHPYPNNGNFVSICE